MKLLISSLIAISVLAAGCKMIPPGHDPKGPGNSENAPGHLKKKTAKKM